MNNTILKYFSKNSSENYYSCTKRNTNCNYIVISSDEDCEADNTPCKRIKVQNCQKQSFKDCESSADHVEFKSFSNDESNKSCCVPGEPILSNEPVEDVSNLPYYLKNFKLAIDTVINDENDAKLFEGEDAEWIRKFHALPITCQKLYVRLFHRKIAWLPVNKINYKKIADDVTQFLQLLVEKSFLKCSITNNKSNILLREALNLLQAPALKTVAKSFHLSTTGTKDQLCHSLEDLCKRQRSVFSDGLKNTVMKRTISALGPCFKLELIPKQAFNRVLLVFDVTKGTEDDSEFSLTGNNQNQYMNKNRQLSTILLAEMGQIVYPSYAIKKTFPVFESRAELLEYEKAYRYFTDIITATESGEWKDALGLCQSALDSHHMIMEKIKKRSVSLPHFIRGFSASAVYVRIKSLQVEVLQRLREYKEASVVLRTLLLEKNFCLMRRGFWSERLALDLDQHLHDHASAAEVIKSALADNYVRVGHLVALVERARKIISSGKVKDDELNDILERFKFKKAKEITIVGRLLPKRMQTGQARFMKVIEGSTDDDVLLCSVEELALDHYKCDGYEQGIHGEGGTFTCFFCLLMWDIIFMPGIDDVFRNQYQTIPLDYNTDDFYLNRKNKIDMRIEQIKMWKSNDFDAVEVITEHWNTYNGIACTGMNWERFASLKQALSLAECIGGNVLGGILEVMAKDPRHTRSGLPDLVVWNSLKKQYKFVEVKGPGDRLSNNQKMWMHRLVAIDANVEVCRVTASASRKILI